MSMFKKKPDEAKKSVSAPRSGVSASPAVHAGTTERRVLIRPYMSEKSARLEPQGTYAFLVRDDANKALVRAEVERRYKVKVRNVNIVRTRGPKRFFRGTWHDGRFDKKALVTLVAGAKIDLK